LPEFLEREATVGKGFGRMRVDGDGAIIVRQCFLEALESLQRIASAEVRLREVGSYCASTLPRFTWAAAKFSLIAIARS
jgi:hypothetical protein